MVPLSMSLGHTVAVGLAVVGAILFGLASVRQHGAVTASAAATSRGLRHQLEVVRALVADRNWLVGSVQAVVAGSMHIVALALAPITLIQPIGVLAVPVTVLASAAEERTRPGRRQVLGAAASVGGIGILTVLLLAPSPVPLVVPPWWLVALTVVVTVVLGAAATGMVSRGPALLRCVLQAGSAAVLFGLNSILIRLIGHLVSSGDLTGSIPLFATAVLGLAACLPVGLWAMQTAYRSGSAHVVICCLTLLDPLTAVGGGGLLLRDGVAASAGVLVGSGLCVVVAVIGVVLLAADYPIDDEAIDPSPSGHTSSAGN